MANYRRDRTPGGTWFFTVTLANRKSDLLTKEIDRLREAVRTVRHDWPFHIDAWVGFARSYSRGLDLARRRPGFFHAMAPDQVLFQPGFAKDGKGIRQPAQERGERNLATPLLGAQDPG